MVNDFPFFNSHKLVKFFPAGWHTVRIILETMGEHCSISRYLKTVGIHCYSDLKCGLQDYMKTESEVEPAAQLWKAMCLYALADYKEAEQCALKGPSSQLGPMAQVRTFTQTQHTNYCSPVNHNLKPPLARSCRTASSSTCRTSSGTRPNS
jgi:hypothetical protein